ncbi:MAG: hypothetical protein U9O94_07355, partial [Nanoarchaeota archaeon]|nr:hypothetical protein [Nanoarchaeota archaeon]
MGKRDGRYIVASLEPSYDFREFSDPDSVHILHTSHYLNNIWPGVSGLKSREHKAVVRDFRGINQFF